MQKENTCLYLPSVSWTQSAFWYSLEAFGCGLAVAVAVGLLGCCGNMCPAGLTAEDDVCAVERNVSINFWAAQPESALACLNLP